MCFDTAAINPLRASCDTSPAGSAVMAIIVKTSWNGWNGGNGEGETRWGVGERMGITTSSRDKWKYYPTPSKKAREKNNYSIRKEGIEVVKSVEEKYIIYGIRINLMTCWIIKGGISCVRLLRFYVNVQLNTYIFVDQHVDRPIRGKDGCFKRLACRTVSGGTLMLSNWINFIFGMFSNTSSDQKMWQV